MALMAPVTDPHDVWEKVQIARHPHRPHTFDYIRALCSDFVELRGDRSLRDDPTVVGGIGRTLHGSVVVIGHQKETNAPGNSRYLDGMPGPEGFRKIQRLMRHAEKFDMPMICLLDTPGARFDRHAEEHGQSTAVGQTLLIMANLRVPIIATVIGEAAGSSGLALGLADCLLMLEHTIFSAVAPEMAAAILWDDASLAPEAARSMKIMAREIYELGLVDELVPEPAHGAHTDREACVRSTTEAILRHLGDLRSQNLEHVLWRRYARHRAMGHFYERSQDLTSHGYQSKAAMEAV